MSKNVKNVLSWLIFTALGLGVLVMPAGAQNAAKNNLDNVPQKNGIYDVPNHPGMKVRVFVHYPKSNAKPAPINKCDLNDPAEGALVSAAGWHLPSSLTYTLNPSSVPNSVGGSNLAAIANNSFKVWTAAISGKVIITQAGTSLDTKPNSDDGINLIAWGSTPNSALAVTYTMYYTSGSSAGTVVGVDTIMNRRVAWSWSYGPGGCNPKAYDVQDILTHELGHWIGLDDHYTAAYANNTMYGYGSMGEIKKDTLTTGDINGALAIYQ